MKTEIVPAFDRKAEIKELFTEYTQMLIDGDSRFREYLLSVTLDGAASVRLNEAV